MTTISVPLPAELLQQLESLIRQGKVPNKAAAMRMALEKYLEDQAVEAVLQAEREPTLYGNIDDLMKKV
ncbi:ribbon-helix-helix protein, CopG family [Candidatus Peregrinibacteria bacterium]|nr:ribbon-helix-helix protein, CopG family [Candidatus Peregrinibacteria bacterium]